MGKKSVFKNERIAYIILAICCLLSILSHIDCSIHGKPTDFFALASSSIFAILFVIAAIFLESDD